MKKFNVVIVTSKTEVFEACQNYLQDFSDLTIVHHETIESFRAWAPRQAIATLMIDLSTIFRSTAAEREYLYSIQNSIPVVRLRFDPETNSLSGSFKAITESDKELFTAIERSIQIEKGQYFVRVNQRRRFILNAKVTCPQRTLETFLTNTEDLSTGGAYIIGTLPVSEGDKILLEFHELNDKTPIEAQVRWLNGWGLSTLRVAGIGVEFLSLTDSQKRQIDHMISGGLSDISLREVIDEITDATNVMNHPKE